MSPAPKESSHGYNFDQSDEERRERVRRSELDDQLAKKGYKHQSK